MVLGVEKYAEIAKQNNEKHLFALESDVGGFSPRGFSRQIIINLKILIIGKIILNLTRQIHFH